MKLFFGGFVTIVEDLLNLSSYLCVLDAPVQ